MPRVLFSFLTPKTDRNAPNSRDKETPRSQPLPGFPPLFPRTWRRPRTETVWPALAPLIWGLKPQTTPPEGAPDKTGTRLLPGKALRRPGFQIQADPFARLPVIKGKSLSTKESKSRYCFNYREPGPFGSTTTSP